MSRFEFKSRTVSWFYHIILVSCGESILLVLWCAGVWCDMADSDENRGRSRKPGAEDRRWSSIGQILGGRAIGRSGDAYAVYIVHKETRSACFLVEPQYHCDSLSVV
jgi:hypothetical protein